MLTAQQTRALKDAMQKQSIEVDLFKIMKDIAEYAIDPKAPNRVYIDLDYIDEKVDYIVNRLTGLGYVVLVDKYFEDKYSSLTIKW